MIERSHGPSRLTIREFDPRTLRAAVRAYRAVLRAGDDSGVDHGAEPGTRPPSSVFGRRVLVRSETTAHESGADRPLAHPFTAMWVSVCHEGGLRARLGLEFDGCFVLRGFELWEDENGTFSVFCPAFPRHGEPHGGRDRTPGEGGGGSGT